MFGIILKEWQKIKMKTIVKLNLAKPNSMCSIVSVLFLCWFLWSEIRRSTKRDADVLNTLAAIELALSRFFNFLRNDCNTYMLSTISTIIGNASIINKSMIYKVMLFNLCGYRVVSRTVVGFMCAMPIGSTPAPWAAQFRARENIWKHS